VRARKVDRTQHAIVQALERAGCLVWPVNGAIDLIVTRGRKVYLLECKTDAKPRLTATQARMIEEGWPVAVVTTESEALAAVGLSRAASRAAIAETVDAFGPTLKRLART